MPPSAITQLIREAIEWCPDTIGDDTHHFLGTNDFVRLVMSINGDQERQDIPDFLGNSWPPTDEQFEEFYAAMSVDDDMVLREVQRQGLSDLARMQSQATTVPDLVLGDTYDTWFKPWPESSPYDLIGDSPEAAFPAATNVRLREFIKLGLQLWGHTKSGEVVVTGATIESSTDPDALDLMRNSASLTIDEYRKRLERERKKGFLAHRRYTFTERPLLRIHDDSYIALRPTWMLDRFCGSQLYSWASGPRCCWPSRTIITVLLELNSWKLPPMSFIAVIDGASLGAIGAWHSPDPPPRITPYSKLSDARRTRPSSTRPGCLPRWAARVRSVCR